MLSEEEIMELLEFYDLTGSYRAAAALAGVDHHTVRAKVAARAAGLDATMRVERAKVSDPFADKIIEWIDASQGRIRADRVHAKLEAMGYQGSERTTRRVVAALKAEWRRENTRAYKPWIPEPGLWCQWDYGEGPKVAGVASEPVLRMAGLEPASGGAGLAGQDAAIGDRRVGSDVPDLGWCADVRVDR